MYIGNINKVRITTCIQLKHMHSDMLLKGIYFLLGINRAFEVFPFASHVIFFSNVLSEVELQNQVQQEFEQDFHKH